MLHFIGLGFGLFVLLFYLLYNDFFFFSLENFTKISCIPQSILYNNPHY